MKQWKVGDKASVGRWNLENRDRFKVHPEYLSDPVVIYGPVVIRELIVIDGYDYAGIVDSKGVVCWLILSWLDPWEEEDEGMENRG